MLKNVAGQSICAQMIVIADGSSFTGSVAVWVKKDTGSLATGAGSVVNEGDGTYAYEPTQSETNADFVCFQFLGTGAITEIAETYTSAVAPDVNILSISGDSSAADNLETAFDGGSYNAGGGGIVAASVAGAVGSVASGGITAASIANGAIDAATFAAGAIDATAIANGAIDAATFAAGAIDAAAIADGAIDAATFAAGAVDAAALATDAVTEIAAGVLAAATAAPIAADVQEINTVTIVGDGSGTPFNV